MASLWKLSHIIISKQLQPGIAVLSDRNPLLLNIIQRSCSRTQGIPLSPVSSRISQKFQAIDKVPNDCILIYRSPITNSVKYCFYTTIVFTVVGVLGTFYTLNRMDKVAPQKSQSQILNVSLKNTVTESLCLLIIMVISNLALAVWCRKQVTRIWLNPKTNKYIMSRHGFIPGMMKSTVFEAGTAKQKRKNPKTAIGRAAHLVNGSTYFFNESGFRTPADYEKVIGGVAFG